MRAFALAVIALLSFCDARVKFPHSEVLQGPDLAATNKADFKCASACRVYADRKSAQLQITQNGNMITNFDRIGAGADFAIIGTVIQAGDYSLENTGELNPKFVFYVVESTAPNFDVSYVYAAQPTNQVVVMDTARFATVLSSLEAVEFSSFSGQFPAGYPRIYATGYDAAGDQCRPVYQARSQSNAVHSWPTIPTAVLTIDFGFVGSTHHVTISHANPSDPPKSTGMTTVYTSPGFVGCSSTANQNYYSTVSRIAEAFTLAADRFDINGVYINIAAGEPIHLNINEKRIDMVGSSTYSAHYDKGVYSVALSWARQTPISAFAFQLDFAFSDDVYDPLLPTIPPLQTTTSIGRWLSAFPSVMFVILALRT